MWEEINKKQNEDKMLQLLYYSRKLYNNANTLFVFKMIILIINAILALIDINTIVIVTLSIIYLILQHIENTCIKNASKAREIFDAILFGFKIPSDYETIKENSFKICQKNRKEFEIQKNNTGEDTPPGIKNWYTQSDGNTKNEIIFKCQIENTKWDEKITKMNSIIFWSGIIILFIIYIIVRNKDSISDFILGMALSFELIIQLIEIAFEYRKYNKNLIERNFFIEQIKSKKIKKSEVDSLQKLINERRSLKLVPFNSIHKFVTIKMHELMKNK